MRFDLVAKKMTSWFFFFRFVLAFFNFPFFMITVVTL